MGVLSNLTKGQKIALAAGGGLVGLWAFTKVGGSAGVGSPELAVVDVRRPTDDMEAIGAGDSRDILLRDIFRQQYQAPPWWATQPPGTTPPTTPGATPRDRRGNMLVRAGSVRVDGKVYHSTRQRAEDNFLVNRAGKVFVRGEVGDSRWWKLRDRLGYPRLAPPATQAAAPPPPERKGPRRGTGG